MYSGSPRSTLASLAPNGERPAHALRTALHRVASDPDAPSVQRALHGAVADYLAACAPRPPVSDLLAAVLAEAEAIDARRGPLIEPHGPARQAALHAVMAQYYRGGAAGGDASPPRLST